MKHKLIMGVAFTAALGFSFFVGCITYSIKVQRSFKELISDLTALFSELTMPIEKEDA